MRFAAVVLLAVCAAGYTAEMSNAQLEQIAGDRSSACAAIANDNVTGRFACAADKSRARSDASPAFEIGMQMHSSRQGGAPLIQAAAQLTFALDHDDAGDFVATEVTAELRLERDAADAVMVLALLALTLLQAGRYLHGTRL